MKYLQPEIYKHNRMVCYFFFRHILNDFVLQM